MEFIPHPGSFTALWAYEHEIVNCERSVELHPFSFFVLPTSLCMLVSEVDPFDNGKAFYREHLEYLALFPPVNTSEDLDGIALLEFEFRCHR